MSAPQRKLGPIADRVVFENERVRIWELRMEPGHQGPVHQHALDHILVQIDGDRMAVLPEPDTEGPYREYLEADVVPGQHSYVTRGGIEIARNVGRRTYHEIIIELKDWSERGRRRLHHRRRRPGPVEDRGRRRFPGPVHAQHQD